MLRDLELGQQRLQVGGKPGLIECRFGNEVNRDTDGLAQPLVLDTEHGGLGDVGVLVDGGLDLGAVHVLATTQDHVLGSVDDVHEAVFVDIDDVAGAEVAVDDRLGRGLRAVEVALHNRRALHTELATLTVGHGVPVLVDHLVVEGRHNAPGRGRLEVEEDVADGGDDAVGLREAVAGRGLHRPLRLADLLDEVGLQGGATTTHRTKRTGVAGLPVGVKEQLTAHRGHTGEGRDLLALDQLKGPTRVPLVHQHELGTEERERMQHTVVGGDVEQRRGNHRRRWHLLRRLDLDRTGLGHRSSRGTGGGVGERHVHQVVHRTAVGELGALREAGGARGVEDAHVLVGIDLDGGEFGGRAVGVDDIGPAHTT